MEPRAQNGPAADRYRPSHHVLNGVAINDYSQGNASVVSSAFSAWRESSRVC